MLKKSNADFVTLLIGVNDWVQGSTKEEFRENLARLLDEIQNHVTNRKNVIVITIPDFSATPTGKQFGNGRDISKGIDEFNEIIIEESIKRNLTFVDINPATKDMANDFELIASDGLHPSKKEYEIWEKMIYPVALGMVKGIK